MVFLAVGFVVDMSCVAMRGFFSQWNSIAICILMIIAWKECSVPVLNVMVVLSHLGSMG